MASATALAAANDQDLLCRRAAPRARVFLSATITTGAAEIKVIVRDISRTGALIDSPVSPRVGSYLIFARGEISVLAQVVRRAGRQLGLRFEEEIDEGALLIAVGRPGTSSAH